MTGVLVPQVEQAACPRLVVFDAPSLQELQDQLLSLGSPLPFVPAPTWDLESINWDDGTPVWYWDYDCSTLRQHAHRLLNQFVYPLVTSGRPYCVAFNFGSDELRQRELSLPERDWLDVEDIGRLLMADAVYTTFTLLPDLTTRVVQTPIEELLARALAQAGIKTQPQIKIGRYRVDFLIEHQGRRIAVEADGAAFHEPLADAQRDAALKELGFEQVIRFSGSAIWRDADSCAQEVRRQLDKVAPRSFPGRIDQHLDQSQKAAVWHGAGPARVLAPAGAGKTLTMVNRVVKLLDQGAAPSSILVLAFNKKAADQLIQRLKAHRVPVSYRLQGDEQGVAVMTFHAFGYRYQRDIVSHAPNVEESQGVIRDRLAQAVKRAGVQLQAKRNSDPYAQFLKALARVKNDLQMPEDVTVEIDSFGENGSQVIDFAPVFQHFQRVQIAAKAQTFDDLIYLAVLDLLGNPAHRRLVQERFTYVLIDEYQDLNASQLALADILSRPHRQLFVVGDDDQLIYGWRFARPTNILQFHDRMPPRPLSQTYTLSTNYRCSRAVVERSIRLISHNRMREPKDIRPHQDARSGRVIFADEPTWGARAQAICDFLKNERTRTGCAWRQLAVLCRFRAQQLLVALALDAAEIPRTPLLQYRVFTDPAANLIRAYIQLVRSPESVSGDQIRLLLNRPNRYLKNELVARLSEAPNPWEMIQELVESQQAPSGLSDLATRVNKLHQKLRSTQTPTQLLDDVLTEFELMRFWTDQASSGVREADDAGAMQVVDVVRMLAGDLPDIKSFLEAWDQLAAREQAREDSSGDTLEREENESQDQVVIGTIHAAKGREYHSVVLVDYNPDLSRMTPEEEEEERRVLYVGVTRAFDSVLVTVDLSKDRVHPYVRELIPPPGPDEEGPLQRGLEECRRRDAALRAEQAQLQTDLAELHSGQTLDRAAKALEAARQNQSDLKSKLDEKERQSARTGLGGWWAKVSGERGMIEHDLTKLRAEIAEAQARISRLEDELAVLRTQPEAAARAKRVRQAEIPRELAELAAQQAAAQGRLQELKLLKRS